jgi:hypothetical protein
MASYAYVLMVVHVLLTSATQMIRWRRTNIVVKTRLLFIKTDLKLWKVCTAVTVGAERRWKGQDQTAIYDM